MYAAQGWHLSCFVFWRTGPRKPKKPSQHMLVMQRDRVPDGKAWGMTPDDVCLARMSVHTQRQMVPKFRQYNIPVQCAVQTKQLELSYWQLLYVTDVGIYVTKTDHSFVFC